MATRETKKMHGKKGVRSRQKLFVLTARLILGGIFVYASFDKILDPAAFLPQANHEFEPVVEGTRVVHDFMVQNQGTAPLEIIKISSG